MGRSPLDDIGEDIGLDGVVEDDFAWHVPLRKATGKKRGFLTRSPSIDWHHRPEQQAARAEDRRRAPITLPGPKLKDEGK